MPSAAAFQLDPYGPFLPAPQPTTAPAGPAFPPRPALRSVEGGRAPARLAQQAVYRRRRLVAALLLTAVLATALGVANAAWVRPAGSGAPASVAAPRPAVHVVQPGETLWSIAGELAPGSDVRATVHRLVSLNGGAGLQVGQRLALP